MSKIFDRNQHCVGTGGVNRTTRKCISQLSSLNGRLRPLMDVPRSLKGCTGQKGWTKTNGLFHVPPATQGAHMEQAVCWESQRASLKYCLY